MLIILFNTTGYTCNTIIIVNESKFRELNGVLLGVPDKVVRVRKSEKTRDTKQD